MKLFTFIIISLIATIVSSTKCKNPKLKCIMLCCDFTQYYHPSNKQCEYIPEYYIGSWVALVDDRSNKTMEFVEYGECETSNHSLPLGSSNIEFCHSPYHHTESQQFILMKYFKVPCNRSQITVDYLVRVLTVIGIALAINLLPILLPLTVLCTCTRKEEKDKLSFKLVSWYFTSLVASALTGAVWVFIKHKVKKDSPLSYLILVPEFFSTSSFLWLSAMGYEIWRGFKEANVQSNSGKVQKRLVWYFISVWGITATIKLIDCLILKKRWPILVTNGTVGLLSYFNVIAFLVLSLKICLIRCRVAKLTTEKHFIWNIIRVILGLCLMMGIPRMLIVILHPMPFIGMDPIFVMLLLEPYMVLVGWCCLLWSKIRCCCCSRRDEEKTERPPGIIKSTAV